MKRKLVNKKVVNSIGVGILAFITATTPVMSVAAEEGDAAGSGNDAAGEQVPGASEQETVPSEATTAIKDSCEKNEEIKKGVVEANEEYEKEGEDPVSSQGVVGNLEGSQEALGNLGEESEKLDELTGEVDAANKELTDALDHANEGIEEELGAVSDAAETVEKLGEAITDELVKDMEDGADSIENAQGQTYENAEAAQEAKDKALAEAAELEAAKDAALEQQEQARIEMERAEGALTLLQQNTEAAKAKYEAATEAVEKANEKLEAMLGSLEISVDDLEVNEETGELVIKEGMSEDVKAALQKAWDALKQAEEDERLAGKQYEEAQNAQTKAQSDYDTAEKELTTATGALEALQEAQKELETATGLEKEKKDALDQLESVKKEAEVDAPAAKTEAQQELKEAKEELKKAQQELLAGVMEEQETASKSAYDTWQKAGDAVEKALPHKKEEAKAAEKEARDSYIKQRNEQTETMISYQLQKDGLVDDVDDVTFSKWVSSRGNNNYVVVSYPAKDEDGNILKDEDGNVILEHKYYDYEEEEGDVTVLEKELPPEEIKYECGNDKTNSVPLTVSEDGFYLGSYKLDDAYEVKGTAAEGYTVTNKDGSPVEVGIKEKNYLVNGWIGDKIRLTTISLPGKTLYFVNGEEASVNLTAGSGTIKVGNKTYTVSPWGESADEELEELVFGPAFTGKGQDAGIVMPGAPTGKDKSALEEAAKTAKDNKVEKEGALTEAEKKLEKAEEDWNAIKDTEEEVNKAWTSAAEAMKVAEGKVADIKKPWVNDKVTSEDVEGYLQGFIKGMEPQMEGLLRSLNEAKALLEANEKRQDTAKTIKDNVDEAYRNVLEAIRKLYDLKKAAVQDEDRWEELEQNCKDAVEAYTAAAEAKGLSDEKCEAIKAAADRAIEAANKDFAYNTSSDDNSGSTGGDENTGGGSTGGGTTGGSSTTTETPADSNTPTVELEEEDVPLAGGAGTATVAGIKRGSSAGGAGTGTIETVKADGNGTSGGSGTELEDEEVPLAGLEEEDGKGKAETGIVVEDEEIPLAAPIEEQSRMSWWWLILIAILGVTGEEMYRRHRKKAAEEKEMNS